MNTILAWIAIFIARWFSRPLSTPAAAILTHTWEEAQLTRLSPEELEACRVAAWLETAGPPAVSQPLPRPAQRGNNAVTTPFVRPRINHERLRSLIENVVCALLLALVLALAVLWPSQ